MRTAIWYLSLMLIKSNNVGLEDNVANFGTGLFFAFVIADILELILKLKGK